MKERPVSAYLDDILECINRIEDYARHMDYQRFVYNDMIQDAILKNLRTMGDAARKIPKDVKDKHPEIPWARIIGARDAVVHDHFGYDLPNLWKMVTDDLLEILPEFVMLHERHEVK